MSNKEEKIFVFFKHRNPGHPDRIEKKESELTKQEKDYLYGQLCFSYQNNTQHNQFRFLQELIDDAHMRINEIMYKEIDELSLKNKKHGNND